MLGDWLDRCTADHSVFDVVSLLLLLRDVLDAVSSQPIPAITCQIPQSNWIMVSKRISDQKTSLTGVKKDSATKRALAFKNNFISEISLSTSSMNCIMKSTSLCFNISSVCVFVIKNEMSYPFPTSAVFLLSLCIPYLDRLSSQDEE